MAPKKAANGGTKATNPKSGKSSRNDDNDDLILAAAGAAATSAKQKMKADAEAKRAALMPTSISTAEEMLFTLVRRHDLKSNSAEMHEQFAIFVEGLEKLRYFDPAAISAAGLAHLNSKEHFEVCCAPTAAVGPDASADEAVEEASAASGAAACKQLDAMDAAMLMSSRADAYLTTMCGYLSGHTREPKYLAHCVYLTGRRPSVAQNVRFFGVSVDLIEAKLCAMWLAASQTLSKKHLQPLCPMLMDVARCEATEGRHSVFVRLVACYLIRHFKLLDQAAAASGASDELRSLELSLTNPAIAFAADHYLVQNEQREQLEKIVGKQRLESQLEHLRAVKSV